MLFMTDDGTAEKNSLKTVWPSLQQLLCHFHVGQAEWRWLHSNTKIPKDKKQELMLMFKKVMYTTEHEELTETVNNIQSLHGNYPEFVSHFDKFYVRWTLFARKGKLTQNNCLYKVPSAKDLNCSHIVDPKLGLSEDIPNNSDGSSISSSNRNRININQSQILECGEKMAKPSEVSSEYYEQICSEVVKFIPFLQNLPLHLKKKLNLCIAKIHTQEQFNSFVATALAQVSRNFKGGAAIRVQLTSIARRRNGVTKGSKRIAAGRLPTKFKSNRVKKRPRNLHKNIMANLPSAKSHGR
ncbi:uncharacterized protein LOC126734897 [Anthonomus grandis grandis]|uniref:uncharacterized protein LOC126734896 n=1 Tax=Anthonomus grandis grandis TaxID=2921223 RepID=UPI00216649AD|nr:uncharacterized protein LOC126734896 [Anthonomus grandis grandis]XP_050294686.1 uncharacterized protein LOC126734897 [Anthonomus grandis grandis]